MLCEDTRVTARLLAAHGRSRRLEAYHEHNAERMRPRVLEQLEAGAAVALASDAGTPLVSDPGYKLVRSAIAAGIRVVPIPGPSAALAALVVSGLPTDRFLVQGFLPASGSARARALAELAAVKATLVLFEAAHRLPRTLADLVPVLGPRPAAVARELTKHFEEIRRGPLDELASSYALSGPPRGETVIVIGPPEIREPVARPDAEVDAALCVALQTMPAAAAASAVARETGRPRRELYRRAVALKSR